MNSSPRVNVAYLTNLSTDGRSAVVDSDAIEFSSSFGDTTSRSDNTSGTSDAEFESEFWGENAMASMYTTYDSVLPIRFEMEDFLLGMDRVLRPGGTVIMVDDVDMVVKIKDYTDQMQWESRIFDPEKGPRHREKLLVAVKQYWTAPASP